MYDGTRYGSGSLSSAHPSMPDDLQEKSAASDPLLTIAGIPRRRSWVELSVGLAALVVSVVSLFVARHQAQVMDRQLAASVWPLLEYSASDLTPEGEKRAALRLRNTGVGPLRIRSFRATYDGQPVTSGTELIEHCCARDTGVIRSMRIVSGYIGGRVLPAGEGFNFIEVRYDSATAGAYADLRTGLRKLRARYCYCSVLDDCWVRESHVQDADPVPVASCDRERREKQFTL
jgi:hypothetical protein